MKKKKHPLKAVLLNSFRKGEARFEKGEILNLQITAPGSYMLYDDTRAVDRVPASYFQIVSDR